MATKAKNRVTKTRGKLEGNIINSQIEIRPIVRGNLDLGKWASATRIAESQTPRRVQLNDMYSELSGTDGHWIGVWAKRVDAVTSADWLFTDKEGNPVEEINQLIDTIGFEEILTEIINSKGWGKTLLEPKFFINENEKNEVIANLIPRNHYRPDLGIVTKDQSSDVGIHYKEGIYARTVMDIGKDKDLGLFLAAAGYAILKRGAVGDWASFVEKFGQGIIDGEWDGYNDAQRLALSKALEGMGSGGIIIRPAGTKITAMMPTGNATGQLQMSFTDFCNKEISKCLLGSTETIDSSNTSGYAQSETHNEQDIKKNETDIKYVRRYLNSEFIKILIAAGFNVKGGTFILVDENHIPEKDAFKIHKEMALELKIPISHDFFYEKYGMPKPDDYDSQIAEQKKSAEQITPIDNPEEPTKTKRPGVKKDDSKEKDVKLSDRVGIRRILDFFLPARSIQLRAENESYSTFKHHLNDVYTCGCNEDSELITLADAPPKFIKIIADLILKIWELKFAPQDQTLFDIYAEELTKAVLSGYNAKADITDWSTTDTRLINSLKNNVIEFSAAKSEKQAKDMTDALVSPNGEVRSWRDFRLVAEQIANTQLNWLKTEYETAIGSGQMAAKWALIQEQKELFPLLQFDAVIDDHSTDLCSGLDKVIKPVDDVFWKIYFPLNHFNCRSTVRQLRDGVITPDNEIEFPANMPEAFKRNLAAEGIAFPKNYYKDAILESNRPKSNE